jgi:hypothetical protein
MNSIKEGVCIDHFPQYTGKFSFTKQQYQDSLLPTEYGVRFKELRDFYTNDKQLSIDNALEEYTLHTYGKSKEDIMKVFSKFHNVKVKGFESFIFKDNTNIVTYYYDKSWLFLTVIEYCSEYKIIKHWED